MSRGPDVATQLARALEQSGPEVTSQGCSSTPWASVTFAGARHRLTLQAPATPAVDRWLATLPDAEFALRGHLVAEVVVVAVQRADGCVRATVEALTVED